MKKHSDLMFTYAFSSVEFLYEEVNYLKDVLNHMEKINHLKDEIKKAEHNVIERESENKEEKEFKNFKPNFLSTDSIDELKMVIKLSNEIKEVIRGNLSKENLFSEHQKDMIIKTVIKMFVDVLIKGDEDEMSHLKL